MKINTYNYTKGTKNIYDKKYHGCCHRCSLAVGIGTTGVISNTTYKKPTQIIAAAKTTTLTDYPSFFTE